MSSLKHRQEHRSDAGGENESVSRSPQLITLLTGH